MHKLSESWVVYRMTLRGKVAGGNAVCGQAEWDALDASNPGYHTLIRANIPTEEEAEKLARGSSGESFGRRGKGY